MSDRSRIEGFRHFATTRAGLAALAVLICAAITGGAAADDTAVADDRAREIVDRVDQIMRGKSSIAQMTMEIQSKRWKRSLEAKAWSKGTDRALILIIKPVSSPVGWR